MPMSSSSTAVLAIYGLLALKLVVAAPQTVPSTSDVVWNCPEQETIEVAYANYCPATDRDGTRANTDRQVYAYYTDAPSTYKTQIDSLYLTCSYGDPGATHLQCNYAAGGGQTLHEQGTQNAQCPDVSQTLPQPSPGVDYRKRSIHKRDVYVTYTCPWTSDTAGVYVTGSGYDSGIQATANYDADMDYYCSLGDTDSCSYYLREGSLVADESNVANCPLTMCDAIKTGTGNMRRGVYRENRSIDRRQVNTQKLRNKLRRRA